MITLLCFLACGTNEPSSEQPLNIQSQAPSEQSAASPTQNLDQGQQHPPIPTHNPIWEWDAKAFVPDFGWFGEHSWTDVRMRVLGHLSIAGRDHARLAAERRDLKLAAERYDQLAKWLKSVPIPVDGHANDIARTLVEDAERDATLLSALAEGQVPAEKGFGIAELRRQYYALALAPNPSKADLTALQNALLPYLARSNARHRSLKILSAATNFELILCPLQRCLRPLGLSTMGYWTNSERTRGPLHWLGARSIGWSRLV